MKQTVSSEFKEHLVKHIIKHFVFEVHIPNAVLYFLQASFYVLTAYWASNFKITEDLSMTQTYMVTRNWLPYFGVGYFGLMIAVVGLGTALSSRNAAIYKIGYIMVLLFRYILYPFLNMLLANLIGMIAFDSKIEEIGRGAKLAILVTLTGLGLPLMIFLIMLLRNTFPSSSGFAAKSFREAIEYPIFASLVFISGIVQWGPKFSSTVLALKGLALIGCFFSYLTGYRQKVYWNNTLNKIHTFGVSLIFSMMLMSYIHDLTRLTLGKSVFIILAIPVVWKMTSNLRLSSPAEKFQSTMRQKAWHQFHTLWDMNIDFRMLESEERKENFEYQMLFKCSNDPLQYILDELFGIKTLTLDDKKLMAYTLIFMLPRGIYKCKNALQTLRKDREAGFFTFLEVHHLEFFVEKRLTYAVSHRLQESEPVFMRDIYETSIKYKLEQGGKSSLKLEHPLNCELEHNLMLENIQALLKTKLELYQHLDSEHLISATNIMKWNKFILKKKTFLTRRFLLISTLPDVAPFQLAVAFAFIGKVIFDLSTGHRLYKLFRTRLDIVQREYIRTRATRDDKFTIEELFNAVVATISLQDSQFAKITKVTSNSMDIFGQPPKEVEGKSFNLLFPTFLQTVHMKLMRGITSLEFLGARTMVLNGFDDNLKQVRSNQSVIANITNDISAVSAIWNKRTYEFGIVLFDDELKFSTSEKQFKRLSEDFDLTLGKGDFLYDLSSSLFKFILISKILDEIKSAPTTFYTETQRSILRVLTNFLEQGSEFISYGVDKLKKRKSETRVIIRFFNCQFAIYQKYLIVEMKTIEQYDPTDSRKSRGSEKEYRKEEENRPEELEMRGKGVYGAGCDEDNSDDLDSSSHGLGKTDVNGRGDHLSIEELTYKTNMEIMDLLEESNLKKGKTRSLRKRECRSAGSELRRIARSILKAFGTNDEIEELIKTFNDGDDAVSSSRKGKTLGNTTQNSGLPLSNKITQQPSNLPQHLAESKLSLGPPEAPFQIKVSDADIHVQVEDAPLEKPLKPSQTFFLQNAKSKKTKAILKEQGVPISKEEEPLNSAKEKGPKEESESSSIQRKKRVSISYSNKAQFNKDNLLMEQNQDAANGGMLLGGSSSVTNKKKSVSQYSIVFNLTNKPEDYSPTNRLVFLSLILLCIFIIFISLIYSSTVATQARNLKDFSFLSSRSNNENALRYLVSILMPTNQLIRLYWSSTDPQPILDTFSRAGISNVFESFFGQLNFAYEQLRENLYNSLVSQNTSDELDEASLKLKEDERIKFEVLRYNEKNEVIGDPQNIPNINDLFNFILSDIKTNQESIKALHNIFRNLPFQYPRVLTTTQKEMIDTLAINSRQVFKTILEGYFKIDKELFQKVSKAILDDSFAQYQNRAILMLALFGSMTLLIIIVIWVFVYKWTDRFYYLIGGYLDVKPPEIKLQMEILQNEQEIFGKHNLNEGILVSVLFNLNSEDFKSKIDNRLKHSQDGEEENKRKRKARGTTRSSKTQKKDYRFEGTYYLKAMTIVALLVFAVFLISVYFVIRTSKNKIDVEKEFTKSQIQLTDFTHYIFSSMTLISDGNFFRYAGNFPEEMKLSNSVDNLVSFWNTVLPSFDKIFGDRSGNVKQIIYGDVCEFISLSPEIERQRQIGLCRAGANGAAKNGGLIGFAYYTKDYLSSIKDRMLKNNQDFLQKSKKEERIGPMEDYFAEDFIRLRFIYRHLIMIMSTDLNSIFLSQAKKYESEENAVMTVQLTLVGILSFIAIIFAAVSVKMMNKERHLGYETMRNICPFIVGGNALVLNKIKNSFGSRLL